MSMASRKYCWIKACTQHKAPLYIFLCIMQGGGLLFFCFVFFSLEIIILSAVGCMHLPRLCSQLNPQLIFPLFCSPFIPPSVSPTLASPVLSPFHLRQSLRPAEAGGEGVREESGYLIEWAWSASAEQQLWSEVGFSKWSARGCSQFGLSISL